MEPLQIVLIVLALVGVWAVIELALTLRRARSTVSAIDKTLGDVQPVIYWQGDSHDPMEMLESEDIDIR